MVNLTLALQNQFLPDARYLPKISILTVRVATLLVCLAR